MYIKGKIRLAASSLLLAAATAGCGVNDIYPDGPVDPDDPDFPGIVNGAMEEYAVWGTVTDTDGNPLAGVSVNSGRSNTVTDATGFFMLEKTDVNRERVLVNFSKSGYVPVQRAASTAIPDGEGWSVVLSSRSGHNACVSSFNTSAGTSLAAGGLKLQLPSGGYISAATGREYSGEVKAEMYYLSTGDDHFIQSMPGGDLMAEDGNGHEKVLVSYGMANVSLTSPSGEKLILADGGKARISFPHAGTRQDAAPGEIPVWWFDETRGIWVYECVATVDAEGNYSAEISLTTEWWNLDEPGDEATIFGLVSDEYGTPLERVPVTVNGQYRAFTTSDGMYSCKVAAGQRFPVTVMPEDYAGYSPQVIKNGGPVASGGSQQIDLVLPAAHTLYCHVAYSDGTPLRVPIRVRLDGRDASRWTTTDKEGNYPYRLPMSASGTATVTVQGPDMETYTETAEILPNQDANCYISIPKPGGSGSGSGDPDIVAQLPGGQPHYLSVARPGATEPLGVIVEDSCLTAVTCSSLETPAQRIFMLQVPGYKPGKTEYTSFTLTAADGTKAVVAQNGTLRITREQGSGLYVFNMSGTGVFYDSDDYSTAADGYRITVNNVGIAHLMTMERRENYSPASPFRNYVPRLSTPAPVAMVVTESMKLGTGGMLYYNGARTAFDDLMAQAARSGLPRVAFSDYPEYQEAEAMYQKDNDTMMLEYDGEAPVISSSSWRGISYMDAMTGDDSDSDPYLSQLMVTSLAGGTLSLSDIDPDDESFMMMVRRAVRKAARCRAAAKAKSRPAGR